MSQNDLVLSPSAAPPTDTARGSTFQRRQNRNFHRKSSLETRSQLTHTSPARLSDAASRNRKSSKSSESGKRCHGFASAEEREETEIEAEAVTLAGEDGSGP